jgi:hypothetical protein
VSAFEQPRTAAGRYTFLHRKVPQAMPVVPAAVFPRPILLLRQKTKLFPLSRTAAILFLLLLLNTGITGPAAFAASGETPNAAPISDTNTSLPAKSDTEQAPQPSPKQIPIIEPPTAPAPNQLRPPSPDSVKPGQPAIVSGHVTDAEGKRAIGHARVVLIKSDKAHEQIEQDSDANGNFTFTGVAPGEYSVTVSAKEMLAYTAGLKLASGENKKLTIGLEDLEPVDILRVTGKRSLIHPEKIGSSTNLDKNTIEQYKTGNDLHQLIESTPGVITDTVGNIIVRGEHNAINYNIDGVYLPESAGVLQQSSFVTPRSLQSMQVDIGGYEASDGGGPLGAIVRMKSLPITSKSLFSIGQQIGGPMAGNIYYNASGALSQDTNKVLNKIRIESSGSFRGTCIGQPPPTSDFAHNNRADINVLTKVEYLPTSSDTIKLSVGLNSTFFQVPTSRTSYNAGVRQRQQDTQDYIILSWKHRYKRFFDESNLHLLSCFYDETYHSKTNFDPAPVINGGQPLQSIAPNANRFNYVLGSQGSIVKTIFTNHRLEAGYLTECRWAKSDFAATYYNNNPLLGPSVPYGAAISPFTGLPLGPGNPAFTSNLGKLNGFRYLQSEYLQDSWRPKKGWLKRVTLDMGVRADVVHNVFGNTHGVEQVLDNLVGAGTFTPGPFNTQRATAAQLSGRYGLAYVINPMTVWRISYSDLFMPLPVDVFSTPPMIGAANFVNGVYNGTVRPMAATRGRLVDSSIERQIGTRFATRTNVFWKYLTNYGDSGVIGNSLLYNRQSVAAQVAYGVESRLELKRARDGYGLNGWLSNTWQLALLRGSKQVAGGIYDIQTTPIEDKYPDHDRRESIEAALGWQSRRNWWVLANYNFLTGLQDERDPALVGPHPVRTPWLNIFGLSAGYKVPKKIKQKMACVPDSFDARFENLLNNHLPTNLGSPFQGTRYLLPFRFLLGCSWTIGQDYTKAAGKPTGISVIHNAPAGANLPTSTAAPNLPYSTGTTNLPYSTSVPNILNPTRAYAATQQI